MTLEQLRAEYNKLTEEEKQIPEQMNNIIKEIAAIEIQMENLKEEGAKLGLKIEELPEFTYEKRCASVFLGIGKTCQEVPMFNLEILGLTRQQMNLGNQLNNVLIPQINAKYKKITELAERQIEIKQRQNEINNDIITKNYEQKVAEVGEPEADKLATLKKYLPYVLVLIGSMVIFKKQK